MKTLAYFPGNCSLNSTSVMSAFLEFAQTVFTLQPNSLTADVAVIWSCLWHGRMLDNQQVYESYQKLGKPIIIIEVGSLKRNTTWKIAVNNINNQGYYGHKENLDLDRPKKLGIKLNTQTKNNNKILIVAQHQKSHQLVNLPNLESWIQEQINNLKLHTDKDIVVRPHPRLRLNTATLKNCQIENPSRIINTYDDFDLTFNWHVIINYNSGVGIQAAIAGTPIIVSSTSLAYPISNIISNIETVKNLATDQWLTEICHTEYTIEEIQQGQLYKRIETAL